jgi:hypothetical protein
MRSGSSVDAVAFARMRRYADIRMMGMLDTKTSRAAAKPAMREATWQRIDSNSRRRIASFCTRLAFMLAMLGLIALPGRRTAAEMMSLLQMVMFFAAI